MRPGNEARPLPGESGSGANDDQLRKSTADCADAGALPQVFAGEGRTAHGWAEPRPLNDRQGADVAAAVRHARPASAVDMLMAHLGCRRLVPMQSNAMHAGGA